MSRWFDLVRWYIRVSPLESRKRALGRFVSRRLSAGGLCVCDGIGGDARMELDLSQEYERAIYLNLVDRMTIRVLRRVLRKGDVFVDGGANVGLFTVVASGLVGESGSVYAFEPQPDITARLRRNVGLNHPARVRVVEKGLWDAAGTMEMRRVAGHGSCRATLGDTGVLPVGDRFDVETVRLDDLVRDPVRLIKMDVEGADLPAIRGAQRILEATPTPHLILEVNDSAARSFGYGAIELIDWLRKRHAYELYLLERNRIRRVTRESIARWIVENPHDYTDLWCRPLG